MESGWTAHSHTSSQREHVCEAETVKYTIVIPLNENGNAMAILSYHRSYFLINCPGSMSNNVMLIIIFELEKWPFFCELHADAACCCCWYLCASVPLPLPLPLLQWTMGIDNFPSCCRKHNLCNVSVKGYRLSFSLHRTEIHTNTVSTSVTICNPVYPWQLGKSHLVLSHQLKLNLKGGTHKSTRTHIYNHKWYHFVIRFDDFHHIILRLYAVPFILLLFFHLVSM